MAKHKKIDVVELEAKRQRVKAKSDNPTSKAYGDKLAELLSSRATARDNFVNWITGLATGSMFLAFSNVGSAPTDLRALLLLSGLSSLVCVLSAMAFKILLEVRFSALELEVSLLKNIWEGHDIRWQLEQLVKNGKEVTEDAKQKLLRNMDESLNYLDENYLRELKKPINFKSKLWIWSYWQTLAFFVGGIVVMALYYWRVAGANQPILAI
jgi:hypothetical protein